MFHTSHKEMNTSERRNIMRRFLFAAAVSFALLPIQAKASDLSKFLHQRMAQKASARARTNV